MSEPASLTYTTQLIQLGKSGEALFRETYLHEAKSDQEEEEEEVVEVEETGEDEDEEDEDEGNKNEKKRKSKSAGESKGAAGSPAKKRKRVKSEGDKDNSEDKTSSLSLPFDTSAECEAVKRILGALADKTGSYQKVRKGTTTVQLVFTDEKDQKAAIATMISASMAGAGQG